MPLGDWCLPRTGMCHTRGDKSTKLLHVSAWRRAWSPNGAQGAVAMISAVFQPKGAS